ALHQARLRRQGAGSLHAPVPPARHGACDAHHQGHQSSPPRFGRLGSTGVTMGQKTHPYGFRLNIVRTWSSKWYEDKHYAKWLHEDLKLRKAIREKFANAGIAGISIERAANKAKVVISTSRPGIIIGRRGAGVEQLKGELSSLTENELFIDIQEVRK